MIQVHCIYYAVADLTGGRAQAVMRVMGKVKSLNGVQLFATPWTVALPGSSIHGIFQARILEWVAISSPGDLPNPGTEPWSPAL